MSVRTKYIHFSSWAKVLEAVNQKDSSITDEAAAKAFLEEYNNPYYYYIGFIQSTKEIYTHGKFYDCSKYDDSGIKQLIQSLEDDLTAELTNKVDISAYESLVAEVEENELVTAKALTDLNNSKANIHDIPTDYVSDEEFDMLVATVETKIDANDLVTINGNSLIGSGDIIAGGRVDLEDPSADFTSENLPESNALIKGAQSLTKDEQSQVQSNIGIAWQYY